MYTDDVFVGKPSTLFSVVMHIWAFNRKMRPDGRQLQKHIGLTADLPSTLLYLYVIYIAGHTVIVPVPCHRTVTAGVPETADCRTEEHCASHHIASSASA